MVWISPITFADGSVLTAAQLNTFLRDDMLETDIGRAASSGAYFVTKSANLIEPRFLQNANVGAFESTQSTEYTDLATVGPSVTLTTGSNAIVFLSARMKNNTANAAVNAHFAVSGATSIEPRTSVPGVLHTDGLAADSAVKYATYTHLDSLNPGENTFTMKYRVGSWTGEFGYRQIAVFPF